MKRNRFTVEAIIRMLREAEVHMSQGKSIAQVSRELGISEQTYYRWRKEYGGMKVSQAKRLKDLEQENARRLLFARNRGSNICNVATLSVGNPLA
jgi:putative transposase